MRHIMMTIARPISIPFVTRTRRSMAQPATRLHRAIVVRPGLFSLRPFVVRPVHAPDACLPIVRQSTAAAFPERRGGASAETARPLSP
jgi:hypothetical protein